MRLYQSFWRSFLALSVVVNVAYGSSELGERDDKDLIKPKVFIISMYKPEGEIWYGQPDFYLLANNVSIPGLSPLFPQAHCAANGSVCQLTTGEGEINAATTITGLLESPKFDLTSTYFLIIGIAGINPNVGSIGDVTFARYAVQVALQYQFDIRDLPSNYSIGYIPLGSTAPGEYPQELYGTEVFELNKDLMDRAMELARKAKLNDTDSAVQLRGNYQMTAAKTPPRVRACDVATSDVYWSGKILGDAFGDFSKLITNGSAVYCTTAQEDNATLEAMLRATLAKQVDYSRIVLVRTASDFDRPYDGQAGTANLFYEGDPGFTPSIQNIYLAGREIVHGILNGWEDTYAKGIKPSNYVGDIFGYLGGTPDFGLPQGFIGNEGPMSVEKRSLHLEGLQQSRPRRQRRSSSIIIRE